MASEASRYVDIDSNERLKLARAYTFAACIGQLVENAAAVLNKFNATLFTIRILSGVTGQICNPLRPVDSPDVNDVSIIKSDALKVIDNGCGFLFEQIRVMLRAGYRLAHVFTKLFGANNQGLKQLCSKLSPAWALLFTKSKDSNGVVWCTILGFGSNFDVSGLLEYVGISWPESASSDDWTQVAAHESFQANHADAAKYVFRSKGGRCWGPLQDMKEANKYFKEIKETGVLGLFPFNQPLQGKPQPALQVEVNNSDIKLQGDSLVEYLERYFVAPEMQLLPQKYWDDAGWAGFEMKVKVANGIKVCKPYMPSFSISKPFEVEVGDQTHTMVYGPHFSPGHDASSLFPYADNVGVKSYSQNYMTFLVSNSRVINHVSPFRPEYDGDRTDYFDFVLKTALKRTAETLKVRFQNMCRGRGRADEPAKFDDLMETLKRMQVFNSENPYFADSSYSTQMKNLHWLLGVPHEVFVRIDNKMLLNELKDDLMKDALVRDMFYGSVHIEIALDLLQRFEPGLKHCMMEADKRKAAEQQEVADKRKAANKSTQRNTAGPKTPKQTPKQKVAPKPRAPTARKPVANKKRTAPEHAPAGPSRRPRLNSPCESGSVSAPLHITKRNRATTNLDALVRAVRMQNPTPSVSRGGASSGLSKQALSSGTGESESTHEAKYAEPGSLQEQAIDACLNSGDSEVVGVVAKLVTVKDRVLAEVLAESCHSILAYVVVKTGDCRESLADLLQNRKLPCPDILPYDQMLPYQGANSDSQSFGCEEQALALMTDACSGTDAPLAVPLPHEDTFGSENWPPGCVGYVFNLLRPTIPGLRARLLYKLLGGTLVFETIAEAAQYRKRIIEEKQEECAHIITLDGGCINTVGVIMGDSYKPVSLQSAPRRFATTP